MGIINKRKLRHGDRLKNIESGEIETVILIDYIFKHGERRRRLVSTDKVFNIDVERYVKLNREKNHGRNYVKRTNGRIKR